MTISSIFYELINIINYFWSLIIGVNSKMLIYCPVCKQTNKIFTDKKIEPIQCRHCNQYFNFNDINYIDYLNTTKIDSKSPNVKNFVHIAAKLSQSKDEILDNYNQYCKYIRYLNTTSQKSYDGLSTNNIYKIIGIINRQQKLYEDAKNFIETGQNISKKKISTN